MDVLFDTSAEGKTIAFPVVQKCTTGQTDWTQVPPAGKSAEDLDTPAPAVTVGPKSADGADADHHGVDAAGQGTTAEADPLARWLGAGGLVAGVAALAVAITSATRRRARG
jgi:hypothetical protein